VKAVLLREVGGDLALEEVAEPGGEHVLDVRAAGVNFMDVLIRRGRYPQMPDLPVVLGAEVAGELDGRRVLALTRGSGGGYAEQATVEPQWTFPLPDRASFADGASFLMTFLTAYVPLVRIARVTSSSTVLVHAGAGGVGCAAIRLAKHLGAYVVATASSEEKREFACEVGADEARGYDDLDGVSVDVVLDPVGGELFARSLSLLKPLGQIMAVGYAGGAWPSIDPALLVGRNVGVHGVYLGRLMKLQPELVRECADELLGMWGRGEIEPVVGARFSLAEAGDAHALIESRRHVGKVVLEP
jgi:NADPH2:quinone reductase